MKTPNISSAAPPSPDLSIVEEDEYGHAGTDGYPVQVCVVGTVYTQEKSAVHSSDGSINVSTTETMPLFQKEKRRKEVVFWCENGPIWFGTNKSMVQAGTSAHLPTGGAATIRHQDAIWVRGDTGTALVSYVMELYGD